MYHHGPKKASCSLRRVMRVPPTAAHSIGRELVCERCSWRDWTKGDRWDAVHPRCALLKDAMPVYGSTLDIIDLVNDLDPEGVTQVGLYRRTGEPSVDQDHRRVHAIWGQVAARDHKSVLSQLSWSTLHVVQLAALLHSL